VAVIEDVAGIRPITRRTEAADVAGAAYRQLIGLLETLSPKDWDVPTECGGWRVSDMAGHLIGAAQANASVRHNVRQQMWGVRHRRAHGGNPLDAVNALQIADHADLSPQQRIDALMVIAPAAIRGRMRIPGPLRVVTIPMSAGGSAAAGMPRSVNLGRLLDVIYTRDIWMHTVDIARAVGRPLDAAPAVNRRIVADVVAEWARRHRQPFDLTLTGAAGGRYRAGNPGGGARLEHDAVQFCRILSGREPGHGLMATRVLF
jgi:uncharacterized protein (TIGR03083 family)